jgi:hypothetical protein
LTINKAGVKIELWVINNFYVSGGIKMEESLQIIAAFLLIWLFARFMCINISMFFARKRVVKHPTEDNAMEVFKLLNAKLGVTINNHPKDWAKYRDMFYHINKSCEIPSELKDRIKKRLVKKGLYIDNIKIIDNYKK